MRIHVVFVLAVLILGTAYRIWPALLGQPYISTFFITEDGYLMLTVARNMAIGLGMSVSEGTIPTNGVQPLATFLFVLPYLATAGDKVSSLIGIHLIHAIAAIAAFFAIRAMMVRALAPRDPGPFWPWIIAALWFLGPLLMRHSMNGLETGIYTLVVVITLLQFARVLDAEAQATMPARLGLGALCGLVVLARNDAVFLVTSIFALWALIEIFRHKTGLRGMIGHLIWPGLLSLLVAAPWLINNKLRFGSIVPISGSSQSLDIAFGHNLLLLPSKLFETAFPMLPIPAGIETHPVIIAICVGVLAIVLAVFVWRLWAGTSPVMRVVLLAYLGHGIAVSAYYGLWFGAPHFLSRYLAPIAPLLILASLIAAFEIGRLILRARFAVLPGLYGGLGVVLSIALLMRALMPGVTLQGHEQVVAWVSQNIPAQAWAGAPQTGTLGYWHDRTLNLDGKVNPAALATRRAEGHVQNYVVQSKIDYVVDWAGVGDWIGLPESQDGFSDAFELIVQDRQENLSVMRRRTLRNP